MKEAAFEGEERSKPDKPRPAAAGGGRGGFGSITGGMASAGSWPGRMKGFLGDVRAEARRVSWPSFKQIQATTIVVILTVFFFGVYFGILDWLFNNLVRRILRLGS